jgi:hypothetical protein
MERIVWITRVIDSEGTTKQRRRLRIKEDTKRLLKALRADKDIVAIVLDPITGFYGDTEGNSNKDVRPIMENLADMCRITHTNVFAIIHENRRTDVSSINKILGAGALGQVFRVAMRFAVHPDGEKHHFTMAPSKMNLTKCGGMDFSTEEMEITLDDGNTQAQSYVLWEGSHEHSSDDVEFETKKRQREEITGEGESQLKKMQDALELEVLGGRKLISDLHEVREKLGITKDLMYKAKKRLGLVTTNAEGDVLTSAEAKVAKGAYWGLPGDAPKPIPQSVMGDVETL